MLSNLKGRAKSMEVSKASHQRLRARHEELEALINVEQKRPIPDSFRISEMKKEKLLIKEQLVKFTSAAQ
jgi:hypothetical protein